MTYPALTYTQPFTIFECGTCGVPIAMPESYQAERRKDHATFYCLNGHPRYYSGQNDVEREKARRIQAEASLARAQDRAEVAERRRAAAQGQVTKVKNRIKNGVCPFCQRSFTNVAAHMETQHSEPA